MILVVHPGSGFRFLPIPDPGSRDQKGTDPLSGFATLVIIYYQHTCNISPTIRIEKQRTLPKFNKVKAKALSHLPYWINFYFNQNFNLQNNAATRLEKQSFLKVHSIAVTPAITCFSACRFENGERSAKTVCLQYVFSRILQNFKCIFNSKQVAP